MARKIFIVDTNVVVSALIGSDPDSPPVRILDAMLEDVFPYIISSALFAEAVKSRTKNVRKKFDTTDTE